MLFVPTASFSIFITLPSRKKTLTSPRWMAVRYVLSSPERTSAAVAFAWNDKITAEKSREELEKEWKEKCASPVDAAEKGEIDDVIADEELRQRICAALGMLFSKAQTKPERKHVNMPL